MLGWTMDAFDYFIVVFVLCRHAKPFHINKIQVAFVSTATLLNTPRRARSLFGLWADRVGRRLPLMVDVIFYSTVGFLCAFAPNFTVLVILRLLYGIGMGGEWGLGAALAMEKVPVERRGFFSGLLQEGYALGYLLAKCRAAGGDEVGRIVVALVVRSVHRPGHDQPDHPLPGEQGIRRWRKPYMFTQKLTNTKIRDVLRNGAVVRRFFYLVALMTAFNWMSHGTQDVYPTFLYVHRQPLAAGLPSVTVKLIAVIQDIGAITDGRSLARFPSVLYRQPHSRFCAVLGAAHRAVHLLIPAPPLRCAAWRS